MVTRADSDGDGDLGVRPAQRVLEGRTAVQAPQAECLLLTGHTQNTVWLIVFGAYAAMVQLAICGTLVTSC